MEELIQYDWPGNVRELENIVERAMIICQGDTLKIDASWLTEKESLTNQTRVESRQTNPVNQSLAEMERQAILSALSYCHGKVYGNDGAAAALRVKPTTLYGKMRKHKIKGSRQHNAH
jgi:formate hydrogenlyase transcriptional activator